LAFEQRLGYKDASVRVVVNGQVAAGYRVGNISVEPPAVTVVGNPQGLSEIAGLVETIPINLDQATETIVRNVPLKLPDGVATVSSTTQENGGPGGVKVTVEITAIEDGISLQRPITQQGIDPNYWWQASPNQAEVFLSGPIPQLQNLHASDVEVVVDLFELKPGVYKLPLTVFHPEGLRVDAILPDPIEVTIGRSIEVPIIQQGLNPSYNWRSSPDRVTVHLLGNSERLQSLKASNVRVIVDLADLEPGAYKFTPIAFVPGFDVKAISPERVDISIQLKATPTVSATTSLVTPEATRSN
jgi:YbbR domain-containing protein